MKIKCFIMPVMLFCSINFSFSQAIEQDTLSYRHFIGTSLWSIANFFPDPGDFYELDYGYWVTSKDALIINAITWKYPEPVGIPYTNENKNKHIEEYPGYIRAFGIGAGYQRFLWKNIYSSVQANSFIQNFYNLKNEKIQCGYQLYFQLRLGYHLELFNNRFYLEPSLSFNYWPVNTNLPEEFLQKEKEWPNYFLFEPHLNFGVNF